MARKFDVQMVLGGKDKTKKAFSSLSASLKGIAIGGVAAFTALTAATLKAAKAAGEQELVETKLAAAMETAGMFTIEAFKANLAYATSLQKTTTFGDEAIITVQTLFANYGIATEKQKELTKATLDGAVGMRMDLSAAAALVAKTIGSTTNALARYGIEVTGAANSSERAASVIKALNEKFGGSAAAEAKTYAGAMKQFKNVIGDLWQELGKNLLPVLTTMVQTLRDKVFVAIDFVNKNSTRLEETFFKLANIIIKVAKFLFFVVEIMFDFRKALQESTGWTKVFLKTLDILGKTVNTIIKTFKAFGSGVAAIFKVMKADFSGARESFEDFTKNSGEIYKSFIGIFSDGSDELVAKNEANNESTDTFISKINELTAAEIASKDAMLAKNNSFLAAKKAADAAKAQEDKDRLLSFKEAWFKNLKDIQERQINWMKQMKQLTNIFQNALSAGFQAVFMNIGSGWKALTEGMKSFGNVLLNSLITMLSNLAANWVLQHGIMIVASKAWALAAWLGAQAVGAAKVIAGWATIPFVGVALGIAAAAALIASMNSQFKLFASGVRGFGGGMAVVGEKGPELINLPTGANVFNNQETRNILGSESGASRGINININFSNNSFLGTLDEISEAVSDVIFEKIELNTLV